MAKLGSDAIDTQLINPKPASDTAGIIRYPGAQLVQLYRRQLLQPSGQGDGDTLAVDDCVDDTVDDADAVTVELVVVLPLAVLVAVGVPVAVNVIDMVIVAETVGVEVTV